MKNYYPDYLTEFQCLKGDCPDSCCQLWEIEVDPETEKRYRTVPGELGKRLNQVLRKTEDGAVLTLEKGRCPMWREDGLCRIQAELGHDALCSVCRTYPRFTQDYGRFRELGLELSCPAAAERILSGSYAMVEETTDEQPESAWDDGTLTLLLNSREKVLSLLKDDTLSVSRILAAMLFYACAVQEGLYGENVPDIDPESAWENGKKFAQPGTMGEVAGFFRELEILTPDWEKRLAQVGEPRLNDRFRPLIEYFVRRYWLRAVEDLDILCRVKFILVSCLLIGALGGDLTKTAGLYSKEIESDPENMEAIFDACYDRRELTDGKLLYFLINAEKNP